jgi:hypothetical protein
MMAQGIAQKVAPMLCESALMSMIGIDRTQLYCSSDFNNDPSILHNRTCIRNDRAAGAATTPSGTTVDIPLHDLANLGDNELANLTANTTIVTTIATTEPADSFGHINPRGNGQGTWEDVNGPNEACNETATSENSAEGLDREAANATCVAKEVPMLTSIVAVSSVPFLLFEIFASCIAPSFERSVAQAGAAATSGTTSSTRFKAIDGVRLLASVHIVMFHLYQQTQTGFKDSAVEVYVSAGAHEHAIGKLKKYALEGAESDMNNQGFIPSENYTINLCTDEVCSDVGRTPVKVLGAHLQSRQAFGCSFCAFGKYWVQAFFLISGFVLSMSASEKVRNAAQAPEKLVRLMARRLGRLYPMYAFSLLLCVPPVSTVLCDLLRHLSPDSSYCEPPVDAPSRSIAASFAMVQTWLRPFHSQVNGPAWFLSNLCVFYALHPHWHEMAFRRLSDGVRLTALVLVYLASFTPHLVCYQFFDVPLYKRWYGKSIHAFIEFHPLCNWCPFAAGTRRTNTLEA